MYFSKIAIALASVPAVLISASSVLAQDLPNLTNPPATDEPVLQGPVAPAQVNRTAPPISSQRIPLSPGDRLRITIPGIGGEEFSGEYEVNFSGDLEVPFIDPVPVLRSSGH